MACTTRMWRCCSFSWILQCHLNATDSIPPDIFVSDCHGSLIEAVTIHYQSYILPPTSWWKCWWPCTMNSWIWLYQFHTRLLGYIPSYFTRWIWKTLAASHHMLSSNADLSQWRDLPLPWTMGLGIDKLCFYSWYPDKWVCWIWKPNHKEFWRPQNKPFFFVQCLEQKSSRADNTRIGVSVECM